MKRFLLSAALILGAHSRPQDEGFNPGKHSGMSGSGSGFNAGQDENINFPDRVQDGFNPGIQDGFNPGHSGSHQGSNRPDGRTDGFNPGSNNGNDGFNPGYSSGSESNRPDSNTGNSGYNPGANNGFNPGQNNGFNPGRPGAAGFRTPIIFAEDEEVENKSSLPPYQPGGDKRPYLRGDATDDDDDEAGVVVLQGVPYVPIIQTANGNFVPATSLPNQIQYAASPGLRPYIPGGNKQQYLRGRQVSAGVLPVFTADNPLEDAASAGTLPGALVFAPSAGLPPYVPGTNKQQYLRSRQQSRPWLGSQQQTRPVQYVPLITAGAAQTLPSPIVFADDDALPPYQPGANKQPYLRSPASAVSYSSALPPYVPGANKQQYLRSQQQYVPDTSVNTGPAPKTNFPPGFVPASAVRAYDAAVVGGNDYNGPKNVLYFF